MGLNMENNYNRDDYAEYDGVPEISNIHCYTDRFGEFAIEADFGGADYANLSLNQDDGSWCIEDPYLGLVECTMNLHEAVEYFIEFYNVNSADTQYISYSLYEYEDENDIDEELPFEV